VYAPFVGAAFAHQLTYGKSLILICKSRDNYKWRIHNVMGFTSTDFLLKTKQLLQSFYHDSLFS
jgi:hypothetical protein